MKRVVIAIGANRLNERSTVWRALSAISPDLVFWDRTEDRAYSVADEWAGHHGVPSVPMSSLNNQLDERRNSRMMDVASAMSECGWYVVLLAVPQYAADPIWTSVRVAETRNLKVELIQHQEGDAD